MNNYKYCSIIEVVYPFYNCRKVIMMINKKICALIMAAMLIVQIAPAISASELNDHTVFFDSAVKDSGESLAEDSDASTAEKEESVLTQEDCICTTLCTVGEDGVMIEVNADCPVCGADIALCIGTMVPPMLRAEGTPTEQFSLPLDKTYYFDLSGEAGNIGSVNAGYTGYKSFPGVPDTSLHYVPFTFIGTLDAYSLDSSSNGIITSSSMANANKSVRNLFLSDYTVSYNASWNNLNSNDLIFGKIFDTNYKLRSLSGGSSTPESFPPFVVGTPSSNEWDQILAKTTLTDPIKNWNGLFSWVQDTGKSATRRVNRGGGNVAGWYNNMPAIVDPYIGFRPVLEVLDPATLGLDGLSVVTLNLNGGSFVSKRDTEGNATETIDSDINIVSAGDSFTAPSNVGLTRPVGNTDTYFKWNTQADGSGDNYEVGDDVPNTVTALYAQWGLPLLEEQFTLPIGETYYFDLSDEADNIGSINMGKDNGSESFISVPDFSLNYAPFTYVGTLEAYSLDSSSNGVATTTEIADANQSVRNLFVSEYTVSYNNDWNDLNSNDLIFGKTFDTNYKLRSLSGGSDCPEDSPPLIGATPSNNEWEQILAKSTLTDPIKNWERLFSWTQDTTATNDRTTRGGGGVDHWSSNMPTQKDPYIGWRPVLEVLDPETLGSDGLKMVTLEMNGGSITVRRDEDGNAHTNSAGRVKIVCAGDSFIATGAVGLNRPSKNTDTFFEWNTESDGSGVTYQVGDSVPNTVHTLYAQWEKLYKITVINGNKNRPTALPGTEITITAANAPEGMLFDKWVSEDGVTFADENATNTTFTMPAMAVTVTATYKDALSSEEQFTLPLGGTYYFDLSGEAGNIGPINEGSQKYQPYRGVPDATLHYVPFTFMGTLNAYNLDSSSVGVATTEEVANAKQSYRNLFVSDYNVSHNVDWNLLNSNDLIFGKTFDTNYILRSLSGGSEVVDKTTQLGGTPTNNEWDTILAKSTLTDPIKNWDWVSSWMQDTHVERDFMRTIRGYSHVAILDRIAQKSVGVGWRPALEVQNSDTLGLDGLKIVTLDLNDGSFVSKRDTEGNIEETVNTSINIICAGDSFTATSNVGLTRPVGNTGTYFAWNTQADGSGDNYKVGVSVPESVTTLYAQWVPTTYAITVNSGSADKEFAAPGETVTIKADMAPSRQVFDQWESLEPIAYVRNNAGTTEDRLVLANKNSATTTFVMPTRAVTITATYTGRGSGGGGNGSSGGGSEDVVYNDYYVITSAASSGGTISPMGAFFMEEGKDKTFTMTPDDGYTISNILVDGESVGVVTTYTFKNIMQNHKIEVIFSKVNPSTGVGINADATWECGYNGVHSNRLHGHPNHAMVKSRNHYSWGRNSHH
ncbi:MAG: InlB B-repeat-containing protein [Candidatus Fimivivens sp.]